MNVVVCVESGPISRATEAALELAGGLGGPTEIVALCATDGPEPELRLTRQMRLSRLVVVREPRFAACDPYVMGQLLACAANHLHASMVVLGSRSDVYGSGMTGAVVAKFLEWPLVSRVESMRLDAAWPTAIISDVRTGGRHARIQIPLPNILTTAPRAPAGGRRRIGTLVAPPATEHLAIETLGMSHELLHSIRNPSTEIESFADKVITAVSAADLMEKLMRIPPP